MNDLLLNRILPAEHIPYAYPFLFIDQVLALTADSITTSTVFPPESLLVTSHLLGGPDVVPGVLLIEMVGQAALLQQRLVSAKSTIKMLGKCKAKFLSPALPSKPLVAEVKILGEALEGSLVHGVVLQESIYIAEVEILAVSAPRPR